MYKFFPYQYFRFDFDATSQFSKFFVEIVFFPIKKNNTADRIRTSKKNSPNRIGTVNLFQSSNLHFFLNQSLLEQRLQQEYLKSYYPILLSSNIIQFLLSEYT